MTNFYSNLINDQVIFEGISDPFNTAIENGCGWARVEFNGTTYKVIYDDNLDVVEIYSW